MGKIKDISGQRFGKLLVISYAYTENHKTYWNCICDCGTEKVIVGQGLREGRVNSCGCGQTYNKADLLGNVYGKLTVVEYMGVNERHQTLWKCHCECGNDIVVTGVSLTAKSNGKTSCGTCVMKPKAKYNIKKISRKDLTGQKFGKLTAIEYDHSEKGKVYWKCLCDCGNEIVVSAGNLREGGQKSCGCSRRDDLTGQVFNRLTVVKFYASIEGKAFWLCKCICGNEKIAEARMLKVGSIQSCGCLQRENVIRLNKSRSLEPGEVGFNSTFHDYERRGEDIKHGFYLTEEEFRYLTQQNCHYCGKEPSNIARRDSKGEYIYSGLDRIDNNRGYEIDNVFPCCITCNHAKDILTVKEFLDWIKRVYTYNFDLQKTIPDELINSDITLSMEMSALNSILYTYKRNAEFRKHSFELTIEDIHKLVTQNCYYCGLPPSNKQKLGWVSKYYRYSGIDRRDNSIDYIFENCVPCCADCNNGKQEMSQQDFLSWVTRVYDHSVRDSILLAPVL